MKSHSAADARPYQCQKRVLPALFHLRCPSRSHQRSARGRTRLTQLLLSAVARCSDSYCILYIYLVYTCTHILALANTPYEKRYTSKYLPNHSCHAAAVYLRRKFIFTAVFSYDRQINSTHFLTRKAYQRRTLQLKNVGVVATPIDVVQY